MCPSAHLSQRLADVADLQSHPQWRELVQIVTGESSLSSAGYPFICGASFRLFTEKVPHLFHEGQAILDWLELLEGIVGDWKNLEEEDRAAMARSTKVIRNMVYTAAITAPSDLWLLRQVISVHKSMGLLEPFVRGESLSARAFAEERGLNGEQLSLDWHFLHARGYLEKSGDAFKAKNDPALLDVLKRTPVLEETDRVNWVRRWLDWFAMSETSDSEDRQLEQWLHFEAEPRVPEIRWFANRYQLELGYRLLPLALSLRALEMTSTLKRGVSLREQMPRWLDGVGVLFEHAGLIRDGEVTGLGARVFQRGPGPFGIIGAYYPYLNALERKLTADTTDFWVNRGENVAASQDANRKTFLAANDALDAFCKRTGFRYRVFVEHAVGKGEATRQRFERDGEADVRYFGADLEDAAINEAIENQRKGVLPGNMQFIRSADIGHPEKVIHFFEERGLSTHGAIMMVGNGFHEIRDQTNEKMIAVFKGYQEAGFLLIFTEETALSDKDLLNTAWNTYHAGFRYVHELSGQGLRPSWDSERARGVWGWRKCARMACYEVLDEFTRNTRTIYPFKKPFKRNPSISVTYFCVPKSIADALRSS